MTEYSINFRLGCHTAINHFTAYYLLSVSNLIARKNISMPTKCSCLNLITSACNIQKVISITPSMAQFLLSHYDTLGSVCQIRSSNFRSACPSDKGYQPFLHSASSLNTGYYILKLKNMQWTFQYTTKIHIIRLIVLTNSFVRPSLCRVHHHVARG